ncbi:VIT domain-containing protein [Chryseobacterium sp. MYb264]|uniref:VIT domain-containing protein n=1 Tax=Chryseobacterium sp. MYb264 TaxID=2745153 RepID=UPI002E0FAD4D|nr:VIT domain-containing protein [Chryseobacterium sp. MYb264]
MRSLSIKLLLFFPVLWSAQIPVIETPDKKGGFEKDKNVILQKLNIETKITGGISTNVVTMVFKNNSKRIMEGRVTFPLPEGVNVSGYALDINGKLRNAVPVEKTKAKEVFETIEKRRVDPGILEKVEGNNFRTRIYPISPNGGERTIQVTYNDELKKSGKSYQYFLPLNYSTEIPQFNVKTTVYQNADLPQMVEKPDGSFDFIKKGDVWVAETHKLNYQPSQNLRINFPEEDDSQQILMQKASNNSAYFLANIGVKGKEKPKRLTNKLAIVWDNSLSGSKRNHIKEFELLNEYFKSNKDLSVKVYFINNAFEEGKNFTVNDGNWSELKAYLSQVTYDGGTDFGQLKSVKEREILFFTDGLSSFGDLKMNWRQPVYTISASNNANFNQLKFISNKTGGEFLNLNENEPRKEVRKLLFQPFKFLGIEDNAEITEVYPSLSQTVSNDFVLTGILTGNKTTATLKFGYGNEVSETKTIDLNASEQMVKDWEISQFWAQKKLNELEIFEKDHQKEIKDLSRQFGLVSNNTSLMVLEDIADYVRYEITPPSELRAEYDRLVKNNQVEKDQRVDDLMQKAENMTANLKKWWETDFDKKPKYYPRTRRSQNDTMNYERQIEEVVMVGYGAQRKSVQASSSSVVSELRANHNVLASLQGAAPGISIGSGEFSPENIVSSGRIIVADIKSDAEYMKFFNEAKTSEEIYQLYLNHRNEYKDVPRYYFDISQLLFKNNDKNLGLKVLSSIADLDLENEELYKLLAYKLKQAEVFDKELWITQKVLEWRPFDPQSYRDYALALEDNGQYQAALENLYKILNQTYTRELAARDYGIEETLIMEINELIARHRNDLNLKKINPKIIADLPVNIRVVINWNKDNTDIDLWVTDPNDERCMYSHKATAIGGRLSNDFRGGFGPEQFLLKKAIKGKYKIETNFYNENQISIAGPTAIMAEIYINYATGKQERKVVVFQNKSESDTGNRDGVLVGEFEF